ncbi:MAG: YpoC family protein [Bacilli bacterium]
MYPKSWSDSFTSEQLNQLHQSEVENYFSIWENYSEKLEIFYQNRDRKSARPYMCFGIALYTHLLCKINECSVEELQVEEIEKLTHKPLNVKDRLQYSFETPDHIHTYTQLKALFLETKKMNSKLQAIRKYKKSE